MGHAAAGAPGRATSCEHGLDQASVLGLGHRPLRPGGGRRRSLQAPLLASGWGDP